MSRIAAIQEQVARFAHGRVPRELRELQVLALAEELFAERGYERMSMDELARRAGVSKPVIYGLVGSKEELFGRCFQRAGEELQEAVTAAASAHSGDFAGLVRATGLAFLRFIEDHRGAWAMLFSPEMGGPAAPHLQAIRSRQGALTATLLAERARAAGADPDPRRLEATAFALNGAIEALAMWRTQNPAAAPEELADWFTGFALPGLEALLG